MCWISAGCLNFTINIIYCILLGTAFGESLLVYLVRSSPWSCASVKQRVVLRFPTGSFMPHLILIVSSPFSRNQVVCFHPLPLYILFMRRRKPRMEELPAGPSRKRPVQFMSSLSHRNIPTEAAPFQENVIMRAAPAGLFV